MPDRPGGDDRHERSVDEGRTLRPCHVDAGERGTLQRAAREELPILKGLKRAARWRPAPVPAVLELPPSASDAPPAASGSAASVPGDRPVHRGPRRACRKYGPPKARSRSARSSSTRDSAQDGDGSMKGSASGGKEGLSISAEAALDAVEVAGQKATALTAAVRKTPSTHGQYRTSRAKYWADGWPGRPRSAWTSRPVGPEAGGKRGRLEQLSAYRRKTQGAAAVEGKLSGNISLRETSTNPPAGRASGNCGSAKRRSGRCP